MWRQHNYLWVNFGAARDQIKEGIFEHYTHDSAAKQEQCIKGQDCILHFNKRPLDSTNHGCLLQLLCQ